MKILLLLLISVMLVNTQRTYNPGVNFMMRNILIDKFRNVIVPDIMEIFHTIKLDDIGVKEKHYEVNIYNIRGELQPLRGDQIQVITSETDNSLYAKVTGFDMKFYADVYGRAFFIHAHGSAIIHVHITEFSFKVEPRISADGDKNKFDYYIDSINIHFNQGDIHLEYLSFGILPKRLLVRIGNKIIDSYLSAHSEFEKKIDKLIVDTLDKYRGDIPDEINMQPFVKYPLTMSLSFPNVPHLFSDRVEIPFDGTIYLTSEGYHPFSDPAPPMPSFNAGNPNNIQIFLNQHVLKTTLTTAKKLGLTYEVNSETLKPFGLVDDVMKVEYLSMLFPRLFCHFESDKTITIIAGVDPNLNTEINFAPDKVHGEFSPYLKFMVGDTHAFTLSFRSIFDATVTFEMRGRESFAKGNLDNIDLVDFTFVAGTVEEIDLFDIIKLFKPTVIPIFKDAANKILNPGFIIPVYTAIKSIFEVDVDEILMRMKDKYMEISFTLDIHMREMVIQKLLKLFS